MKPRPYCGVSGVTTPEQARALLDAWPADAPTHSLMIGVLASQKTMSGGECNARSPGPEEIFDIFQPDPRALNLIHYFTKDTSNLCAQLLRGMGGRDDVCDGVQINVPWPPLDQLAEFAHWASRGIRIVLQVGPRALAGRSPLDIAVLTDTYEGLITDVLLDTSAGQGAAINPAGARIIGGAIRAACPWVGIGIAGGLCVETLPTVADLVREYDLSIDAEGRLRNERDELDLDEARAYLAAAAPIVCRGGR